MIVVFDFYV